MTERSAATFTAIGTPGLNHWDGTIDDEWDRRLKGRRGPAAYREMAEADPTVGALMFAVEALVTAAGYRLDPADESPAAEEAATFAESCLDDMDGSWSDVVSEMLTCLPYGFALLETVYKRRLGDTGDEATSSAYDDGLIGWARWSPRSQETIDRWVFDAATGLATAAVQIAPPTYAPTEIPLNRCVLFRAKARRQSPQGQSLIRNAFKPWYYREEIQRIEAIGIERDTAGMPMVRIPSELITANGPELADWKNAVTNVRRDEQAGLVLPSDRDPETGQLLYEFLLLSTGGSRQIDTEPIVARYTNQILSTMLGDFLTLGQQGGTGSYALGVSRTDLFLGAVSAILDRLGDVINTQGLRRLWRVNGMDLAMMPTFAFNAIERRDVVGMADVLSKLIAAGIVDASEPDLKAHVYAILDLPLPEQTDEQEADETGETVEEEDPEEESEETNPPRRQAIEPGEIERAVARFRRHVPAAYDDILDAEVDES